MRLDPARSGPRGLGLAESINVAQPRPRTTSTPARTSSRFDAEVRVGRADLFDDGIQARRYLVGA